MKNKNQFIFIIRGKTGAGKTTLVNKICKLLKIEKIIIDDIKKGVSGKENRVERIFKTAGSKANKLLKNGHNIIVEEAFLNRYHVELFFQMIDKKENYNIEYFLLKCSKNTAIKRKTDLKLEVIEGQHRRITEQIKPSNELIINTESKSSEKVLNEFLNMSCLKEKIDNL